jgi:hypothetical protein
MRTKPRAGLLNSLPFLLPPSVSASTFLLYTIKLYLKNAIRENRERLVLAIKLLLNFICT